MRSDVTSDLTMELRIGERHGRAVPVEVLQSPCGEASASATFPYDDLALESRLKDLQLALLSGASRRRRVVPEYEQAVLQFGKDLFESLFVGQVRSVLDRSLEQAASKGASLRIELRFESAEMAALPWEFLYDPERDTYLALSRMTPIVRYVDLAQPQRPLQITPPLRVLAMVASPTDLAGLDVEQERGRVTAALSPLADRIELTWIEGQTWRDLQVALQDGPWHAFHFIGHGGFDVNRGEGVIALCDERGESARLGATELGRLLGDHEPLRLAVLNSCDGARVDRLDIFSSTAGVLVRRGTPAVIAMQYEITDAAAVELSRAFYGAIAHGLPVDVALAEARKAVSLALPGTLEWGTPVLYLRAPDGRIFDVDPNAVRPVASTPSVSSPTATNPRRTAATGTDARRTTRAVDTLRKRWPIAAAVAVALVVIGMVLALRPEDEVTIVGDGTHELAVNGYDSVSVHRLELPEGSAALVEVNPFDQEVDPVLGVVTSRTEARQLERYLEGAGFYLAAFDGAFAAYGVPPTGRTIGFVDEESVGVGEAIIVVAPFGGAFDVAVGGNGGWGDVELTVRVLDVGAPDDGVDLIDALVEDEDIAGFLSPTALDALASSGMIYLPYVYEEPVEDPVDEPFDPAVFGELGIDDELLGLDDAVLACVAEDVEWIAQLEQGWEEELMASISRCGG